MSRVEITVAQYRGYGYDCRTLVNPEPELLPIVLVGGAFQEKNAWGRLETLLAGSASVVTVDLPGWGDADLLPARYSTAFLAEALHHVLQLAGHRRAHVFGGSYGGAIAFRLAQQYPQLVQSLALMGTGAAVDEPLRSGLLRTIALLRADRVEEFAQYSVSLLTNDDPAARIIRGPAVRRILTGVFDGISADDAAKFIENTLRLLKHELHGAYPLVTVPVLLGTGEHDDFTTPRQCRALGRYCTDARFTALRNADHAVHLEVPDALADLLLRFFSGRSLDGSAAWHSVQRCDVGHYEKEETGTEHNRSAAVCGERDAGPRCSAEEDETDEQLRDGGRHPSGTPRDMLRDSHRGLRDGGAAPDGVPTPYATWPANPEPVAALG
jgi:pimeloyl-ACP methyl ester carboxylesterase